MECERFSELSAIELDLTSVMSSSSLRSFPARDAGDA
jgi:hypothetical protein